MPLRCYVKGCKRNKKDDREHSFFRVPKNPKIQPQWLEFAEATGDSMYMRICSDHFEHKYVWKRYPRPLLTRDAIPTLCKPVLDVKPIVKYPKIKTEPEWDSLEADCSHKVTGIDVTIDKPAADQRALVHIETNYPVRVKLSGKSDTGEYKDWAETHREECHANHEGSAGKMTVDSVIETFQRSESLHDLKYANYAGDGDSKTFKGIVDLQPYAIFSIEKKECIGHVQKRMGARL